MKIAHSMDGKLGVRERALDTLGGYPAFLRALPSSVVSSIIAFAPNDIMHGLRAVSSDVRLRFHCSSVQFDQIGLPANPFSTRTDIERCYAMLATYRSAMTSNEDDRLHHDPLDIAIALSPYSGTDQRIKAMDRMLENPCSRSLLRALAESKAPSALLERLFDFAEGDEHIQWLITDNPDASASILEKALMLSDNTMPGYRWSHNKNDMREAALKHPNLPIKIMEQVLERNVMDVRDVVHIASNPSCPTWMLEDLATSQARDVRLAVARNPSTTSNILRNMVGRDWITTVTMQVFEHPNLPHDVLMQATSPQADRTYMHAAVRNPSLPAEVIRQVMDVNSDDTMVLYGLARNRNTPGDVLDRIVSTTRDKHLMLWIGQHPNVEAQTLRRLALSNFKSVRAVVLASPNRPSDLWVEGVKRQDRFRALGCAAETSEAFSEKALVKLLMNADTRKAAACNPRTPLSGHQSVINQLVEVGDTWPLAVFWIHMARFHQSFQLAATYLGNRSVASSI